MNQRISQLAASARENADRGAAMFLVAATVLIVMVAGAIAVDLSALATRGQSLQNAADAAALAGVQELRDSMGERTESNEEDEAAATAAINALLAQNGIEGITPVIEFPDDINDTEVRVTLKDEDAGFLLSEFTGGGVGTVEREATARFERCEDDCLKQVDIPPPFQAVNTSGDGDGYKPIPVGDRLYSINHQSGYSQGTLQITCVLRGERDRTDIPTEKTQLCWDEPWGEPVAGMLAYPTGYLPNVTPEMPHAAVFGSKIYWASSTPSGHYLFCFETETPAPCSTPFRLNSSQALNFSNGLEARESHRGGGTVVEDGLIYTFTDDHMVHCVVPGDFGMSQCSGYPKPSSLGQIGFPANVPNTNNDDFWLENESGSSIDRIVDDSTNHIYSTIKVVGYEVPASCSQPGQANLAELTSGDHVVIKNSSTLFLARNSDGTELVDGVDAEDTLTHWRVLKGNWSGQTVYAFASVEQNVNNRTVYLSFSQGFPAWNQPLEPSETAWFGSGGRYHSVFRLDYQNATSRLFSWDTYNSGGGFEHSFAKEGVINLGQPDEDFVFLGGDYETGTADWIIRNAACEIDVPTFGPDALPYETGTYLNCFDTSNFGGPCLDFTPVKLHDDDDSFSGRLFFVRDSAGTPTGICSTGFSESFEVTVGMQGYQYSDFEDETEITCVTLSGQPDPNTETHFSSFRNELASHNTGDNGWGTWGDPHYNRHSNRLFYPTHRVDSAVICWDFNGGGSGAPCAEGLTRSTVSGLGPTQDYGYFSEGNCIYGLGHTAVFWAFRADNIQEECNGSGKTTPITPCNCGGSLYWGTLSFDVAEEQFEEFTVEIRDDDGNPIYPTPSGDPDNPTPPHSLIHGDGNSIDLNRFPATDENQRLWVVVNVVAKDGIDPWADGEGSQSFTIEIERTPRLTD